MNWRHYDALILKKLKPRSRNAADRFVEEPKPELSSLLSNPILVNLDEISSTKTDRKKPPRLPCTCFVCDEKIPNDERRHNDVTLRTVSACEDVTSQSAMTSKKVLNASNDSGDSGVFSEDSNSGENFAPQARNRQLAAKPRNRIVKRRIGPSGLQHPPQMKRVRVDTRLSVHVFSVKTNFSIA